MDLVEFVREREAIRHRKESGAPLPWTADPILREYRFTNVRRRHDRVSQWLIKNVLSCAALNSPQFLPTVALCRFVNWPPSIRALLDAGLIRDPLPWRRIGKFLDRRRRGGEKTWSAAYIVRGQPQGKGLYIATTLGKGFKRHGDALNFVVKLNNCAIVHAALRQMPEFGPFLAGQVVADLTYTPLLEKAEDLYTWAPLGPGSRRGYNRILGRPLKSWPKPVDFVQQLQLWRLHIIGELGTGYGDLTLHDVQNVLCEYDKYERARLGQGRPRTRYHMETAF